MASSLSPLLITTSPYGSWKSPITSDIVAAASKQLGGMAVDSHGRLIWLEFRPDEDGRGVLVRESDKAGGKAVDITPKEYSVRTLAQEYGGGDFTVSGDTVVFANYSDQRLYKQLIYDPKDSAPKPLTPNYGGPVISYADGVLDSRFNRFIAVREDRRKSSIFATTDIVVVKLGSDQIEEPEQLVGGKDFYAFPRIDPKGERIAWIEWSHPNMPWDKAQLWVGYFSETGDIYKPICIAGADSDILEAPSEPKWSPNGELYFMTDRKSGYWNLYKWVESSNSVVSVYSLDAEFSKPMWTYGTNSYEFIQSSEGNDLIVCNYRQKGWSYLGLIDEAKSALSLVDIPFSDIDNITLSKNYLFVAGASATQPSSVGKARLDVNKAKAVEFETVWSSSPDLSSYNSYLSTPELIEFPTEVKGQTAYAYFYPPSNPDFQASQEERPPLLLKIHGGPTKETRGVLDLSIQYYTSRGWAVVDVNYGGSTGYGREYRERLLAHWGIVDVNDCCSCAKFLAESGKVDSKRLCITGGSAGGYTTLATLAFRDVFQAGASLYGIADLKLLREETHKFESHYVDNLVGGEAEYYERSPINSVDKISCPIIIFQGLDDKVVPPDQARKIYQAVKDKGLPVALVTYEGEQHGFRKAKNIKFTLEQQMVFFARLVGHFEVADDITPIKIDNFDD